MATNWTGGTGGWNTIANWSGGIPNADNADATIAIPGTITLEVGDIDQVDSLLLNNAAATLNLAGTLALGGPFALLDVAAGAVQLAGSLSGGALELDSGSVLTDAGGTFTGALDAAGGVTINLGGGTFSISGTGFDRASITGAGTLALAGIYDVGGLVLSGGQTELIAAGLAVQDGAATLDSALLTIASGAAYEINAAGQSLVSDGAGIIINSGLFTKANDDSTNTVDASVTNTTGGVITVPRGVLNLQDGGILAGTLNGPGELELGGGNFTLAATSDSVGTLALSNASVTLGAPQSFAGTFLGGSFTTLALAGQNLTLSGTADLTDAGITGTGGLTLSGSGALQLDIFNSGATLTDTGSFNQTGDVLFQPGAAFTVAAGADYDFTSDSNLSAQETINLAGEIEKTAGTGYSVIQAPVANTGLILGLSGALDFTGPINNTGLIESTGPGDIILSTVTGAGTIEVIDSATTLAGPVSAGQVISFSGTGNVVTLSDAAAMAGKITGFAPTDTIAFSGISVTPGIYTVSSGGLLTLPVTGGTPITLTFAAAADNLAITLTASGSVIDATTAIPAPTATTEWDSASADWNSANWSNGIPNAATINAGITTAGTYTVTLAPTDTYKVGSLLLNDSTAILALEGSLHAQSLTLAAGTLQDSGTFTGALDAASGSTINLAGTNLSVSGVGDIAANITGTGTLAIAGLYHVGGQSLAAGITELVTGVAIQDGNATFAAGAFLTIATDAAYEVNADNLAILSNGAMSIRNTGLFTKANDPGTTDVEGAITNTSAGIITVPAGALDFLQGGILDGSIDGPGEVLLGAGTFTLASSDDTIGTLGIGAANVVLGANQSLASNFFTTAGSSISLNGHNLTLSGTSSLSGADVSGTGTINVTGTGETNATSFSSGATFLDSGSINQDGALTLAPGANFTIASGADYDLTSDTGITATGTITLDGELEKTAGTGTSTITAPINNTGLILGLSGDMAFTGPITNTGLIESSGPGDITLSTVTGTGTLELLSSSMTLNGPVSAGQTITLAGANDVLTIGQTTGMLGTITGFAIGDTIITAGFVEVSESFATPNELVLTDAGGQTETIAISASLASGAFIFTTDNGRTEITAGEEIPVCYLRGTRILTPAGEREIESLNIGDAVITKFGGYRQIKWIGRQSYASRFIANNFDQIPVRIMQNALGPNLPKRDLFVSAGHAMLIDGALILAKSLVNGITILQQDCPDQVDYFQLEFETHDCIMAEGTWSESYADTPDWRNKFHNAAEFWALYPNHTPPAEQILCAPRPLSGPALDAALRPIITALNPKPGKLHGYIDEISPAGLIRGWAWDEANPNLPVLLEIIVNNRLLGTVLACDHRPDLESAAIARGRAAFSFTSPIGLPAANAEILVRRANDGAILTQTPAAASRAA